MPITELQTFLGEKSVILTGGVSRRADGFLAIEDRSHVDAYARSSAALLQLKNGSWSRQPLDWTPRTGLCSAKASPFIFLAGLDHWTRHTVDGVQTGKTPQVINGPTSAPAIQTLGVIDGNLYAAGLDRHVWRLENEEWTSLTPRLRPGTPFLSLFGRSAQDISVVGWDGELWHFNGTDWTQQSTAVTEHLTGIAANTRNEFFVCGHGGTVLHGQAKRWSLVPCDRSDVFTSIVCFQDHVFIASATGLYQLSRHGLEPIAMPMDGRSRTGLLSAGNDCVWSIGKNGLLQFDGQAWDVLA